MSWGSLGKSTATYSATTSTTIGWQQLSSVTEGDGGVDFVLQVNDDYPLRVIDARPSYIIDDIEAP